MFNYSAFQMNGQLNVSMRTMKEFEIQKGQKVMLGAATRINSDTSDIERMSIWINQIAVNKGLFSVCFNPLAKPSQDINELFPCEFLEKTEDYGRKL